MLIIINVYFNKEFKGEVDFIDFILNIRIRIVILWVVLNNKDDIFKLGMFVIVNIEGSIVNNDEVLIIFVFVVLWIGECFVVYLKIS